MPNESLRKAKEIDQEIRRQTQGRLPDRYQENQFKGLNSGRIQNVKTKKCQHIQIYQALDDRAQTTQSVNSEKLKE